MTRQWDSLLQGGLVFDGNGGAPAIADLAIKDDKIVLIGKGLDASQATEVIDVSGQWVMPGLVDVHTHYDLELELDPRLPESVRHGTTTVVMSNCSLGLAFGAQRIREDDPLVSCFARVESMPKAVIKRAADNVDWDNSADYLTHLAALPLGPNVVPMIPHSMLRIEVMGLTDSVTRHPTKEEQAEMERLLRDGLQQGYAGFSTDALPFHFLANDPNRRRQIPTVFAKYDEVKRLTSIVREHDKVWQATPPKDSPLNIVKTFLLTSGRLHGRPLKTTVVAAMDVTANMTLGQLGLVLTRILNSRLIKGDFNLQALAAPFKIWADGLYSPLVEEIDALREIIELDMEDREGRQKLLRDPEVVARFKAAWMRGKTGVSLARLRRWLRRDDWALTRDFRKMLVERAPISTWDGKTFQDLLDAQKAGTLAALSGDGWADYVAHFEGVTEEADFMVAVLRAFDNDISWSTYSANEDPDMVRQLLMHPLLLPGFNDSGAHLTNMAFYDCNLRAIKIAAEGGLGDAAYMVKRLTKDVSALFGLGVGVLEPGAHADVTVINPSALQAYDGEKNVKRIYRDIFEHEQLVNRSDGVVPLVMINGQIAWRDTDFGKGLGQTPMGRLITVT